AAIAGTLAGVELKALASSSNHIGELTWAAKPDAGINSIKDLVGKKVAYTSPKSITEMVIRTALKQEGLAGKVDILPLGGLGPALTALAQGAVAAAPFNDPALTVTPDKYKVLFYGHQYYPKFTWQVAVTTKEFAAKNSQTLRKILKVHRQALEFVYNNREETARIYAQVWEVSLAEANAILPKYYEWQHWSRGDFSKDRHRRPHLRRRAQGAVRLGQTDRSKPARRRLAPPALMAKPALRRETAAAMPGRATAFSDTHVALRGISHTYPARAGHGAVAALGPLDFDFRRGEFVGVVGPSGCGKSTLLDIIAGLLAPTSGTIEMDGRAITGTVAQGIGVVFQEDATFAWLNVWDNVAFGL